MLVMTAYEMNQKKVDSGFLERFPGRQVYLQPMNQLTKSLLINVIHAHLLCFTFDELAVERRVEKGGVEADQLFMNNEFLLGRCLGDDNGDKLLRFAR